MKNKLTKIIFVLIVSISVTFTSCKKDEEPKKECLPHFGYEPTANDGPKNWALVCPTGDAVNECGSNIRQSPIDIKGAEIDANLKELTINYQDSQTEIINNGHTVQFNYKSNGVLVFNNKKYNLQQFHFHALSEHKLDGNQKPLEVHLVHQSEDKKTIAVIGVFYKEGAENKMLAKFLNDIPKQEGHDFMNSFAYNAKELLPADKSYFNYKGSLTTPPCSEVVEWIVMEKPLEASKNQLEVLSKILKENYRPIQNTGSRKIGKYSATL